MKTKVKDAERRDYHPTLWRTSRVLANRRRLDCLKAVLDDPGLTVEAVAEGSKVPVSAASVALRALQARGLISARRISRWVSYHPVADPLVPSAEPVLKAVSAAFQEGLSAESIIRQVTAFTHPRRLLAVRCLQKESPLDIAILAVRCQMSGQAAYRHVGKLAARGVVSFGDGQVALLPVESGIPAAFLALIARDL
jgi:DNA-binding transcriptional ArsR family regulator